MPSTLNIVNNAGVFVLQIRNPLSTQEIPIGHVPSQVESFLRALTNNSLPEYYSVLRSQAANEAEAATYDTEVGVVTNALKTSDALTINGEQFLQSPQDRMLMDAGGELYESGMGDAEIEAAMEMLAA